MKKKFDLLHYISANNTVLLKAAQKKIKIYFLIPKESSGNYIVCSIYEYKIAFAWVATAIRKNKDMSTGLNENVVDVNASVDLVVEYRKKWITPSKSRSEVLLLGANRLVGATITIIIASFFLWQIIF